MMNKTKAAFVLCSLWLAMLWPADRVLAYRDLETGAFLTRDPAGMVDGPNLYSYVRQNPWTHFDPEGLFSATHMWDHLFHGEFDAAAMDAPLLGLWSVNDVKGIASTPAAVANLASNTSAVNNSQGGWAATGYVAASVTGVQKIQEGMSQSRIVTDDDGNASSQPMTMRQSVVSVMDGAEQLVGTAVGTKAIVGGKSARTAFEENQQAVLDQADNRGAYVRSDAPAVQRTLPKDKNGILQPDTDVPHTQLGRSTNSHGAEPQAREWMYDEKGRLVPKRDIDFTDHRMPSIHLDPHQHTLTPANSEQPVRGGLHRSDPEPLKE